jgi:ABC-type multidrug transport system ATPase subunit
MDPKARRILWNCLNKIKNKGKSLILTTHSMDETEALCTKIGIMVNGELKCYGSLQHLKSKYGEGYTLLAKIGGSSSDQQSSEARIKRFISFIHVSFKHAELKENRDGFVNMHIRNSEDIALSTIFAIIENNKLKYYIQYYVVTQTKLEQIFLNFAAMQVDVSNRRLAHGSCLNNICF